MYVVLGIESTGRVDHTIDCQFLPYVYKPSLLLCFDLLLLYYCSRLNLSPSLMLNQTLPGNDTEFNMRKSLQEKLSQIRDRYST